MNVEIGTVATLFLFWQCLFRIFGIGSLQCDHIIGFSTIVIFRKFRGDILNRKVEGSLSVSTTLKTNWPAGVVDSGDKLFGGDVDSPAKNWSSFSFL
jgi:hypothetical protein